MAGSDAAGGKPPAPQPSPGTPPPNEDNEGGEFWIRSSLQKRRRSRQMLDTADANVADALNHLAEQRATPRDEWAARRYNRWAEQAAELVQEHQLDFLSPREAAPAAGVVPPDLPVEQGEPSRPFPRRAREKTHAVSPALRRFLARREGGQDR